MGSNPSDPIHDATGIGFNAQGKEKQMKNKLVKVVYGLLIPAIVTLLAISCSASAVWGS
jgi:hypothetical protein